MYVLDFYAPKNFSDCINKSTISSLTDWYKSSNKPCLLVGQTGVGKSTIVRLFAAENNLTLYELNPSDDRDKDSIDSILQAVSQSRSIFSNKNLLFFDDIDVFIGDDRGGFESIVKIVKDSKNPVIFTVTNLYADKKLAILRDMCDIIEMRSVHSATLSNFLSKICIDQKIKFDKDALDEVIKNNAGDLRSTFLDIDYLGPLGIIKENISLLSGRERKADVFKTIIGLFRAKTFSEAQKISDNTEIDYDLLFAWISENLHLFYENENLKEAYELMSLADLNKSRIYSRQNWVFFKYFISLGIVSPSIVPKKDKFTFKISFPQSIKMKAKESSEYSKNKKVATILGKVFRGSNSKISGELFIYKFFFKNGGFLQYLQEHLIEEDLQYLEDFFKVKLVEKQKDVKDIKVTKDLDLKELKQKEEKLDSKEKSESTKVIEKVEQKQRKLF
jgi:DNA polymerase III delta prime subunit